MKNNGFSKLDQDISHIWIVYKFSLKKNARFLTKLDRLTPLLQLSQNILCAAKFSISPIIIPVQVVTEYIS
jgi:hypothetical protein